MEHIVAIAGLQAMIAPIRGILTRFRERVLRRSSELCPFGIDPNP